MQLFCLPRSRQRILAQQFPETGLESQLPEYGSRNMNHRAPADVPRPQDGLRDCANEEVSSEPLENPTGHAHTHTRKRQVREHEGQKGETELAPTTSFPKDRFKG